MRLSLLLLLFANFLLIVPALAVRPEPPIRMEQRKGKELRRTKTAKAKQKTVRAPKKRRTPNTKLRKLGAAMSILGAIGLGLAVFSILPAVSTIYVIIAMIVLLTGLTLFLGNRSLKPLLVSPPGSRTLPDYVSDRARRWAQKRRTRLVHSPYARSLHDLRKERLRNRTTTFEEEYRKGKRRSALAGILLLLGMLVVLPALTFLLTGVVGFSLGLYFLLLGILALVIALMQATVRRRTADLVILYEDGLWKD